MAIREIDWASSKVSDHRALTVALAGESDADWCEAFTAVAGLLDAASHNHLWGEVAARAGKAGDQITVQELEIGDPEHVKDLREFVEAVARQASADASGAGAPGAGATLDAATGDSPAESSTRAFRALAKGQTRPDAGA
ncbi:MAG: hypothetical protein ABSF58_04070 [Solirubrobacteraceae bacterium]|jgi:hypothetical protein